MNYREFVPNSATPLLICRELVNLGPHQVSCTWNSRGKGLVNFNSTQNLTTYGWTYFQPGLPNNRLRIKKAYLKREHVQCKQFSFHISWAMYIFSPDLWMHWFYLYIGGFTEFCITVLFRFDCKKFSLTVMILYFVLFKYLVLLVRAELFYVF